MAEDEKKTGNLNENLNGDRKETIDRGRFSRKNFQKFARGSIPKSLKSSDETFNAKWDEIYKPLPNGKDPSFLHVSARLFRENTRVDFSRIGHLGSRIAKGVSEIADAMANSTTSLSGQDLPDLSSRSEAHQHESHPSIEHVSDTPSIDRPKSRMPRVFNRPPSGLDR